MGRRFRNRRKRLRKKRNSTQTRLRIEERLARYLTDLSLPYQSNHHIGHYNVDFLVDDHYIIECYGDFFHCNPEKYPPDYYNRVLKCAAQVRWARDQTRETELKRMGYRFLSLWEHEIAYHERYCKSKIRKLLTES